MSQPWPRDSNETASDQPGAVHSPRSLPIAARFKPLWTPGWEGLSLETRSCGWSARKLAPGLRGATGRQPKEEAPPYKSRCGLALNGTVTEEIYEVGFNASTRFREESTDILVVWHWLAAE
jgi:hypothetical protein